MKSNDFAIIALGSNVGDSQNILVRAIERLAPFFGPATD